MKAIQTRQKEGKPLNYMAVRMDDSKLTDAARRYFGNWDNALTAAGAERERPARKE